MFDLTHYLNNIVFLWIWH